MIFAVRFCLLKFILIIYLCVTVSHQKNIKETELTPFEFDDFLYARFATKSWNGTWISDTAVIYRDIYWNTWKLDFATKQTDLILNFTKLEAYGTSATLKFTDDLAYVLIKYNSSAGFRYSTIAQYTLYDIKNERFYNIANSAPLRLVAFVPQNNRLVYVQDNNIYYLEDFTRDVDNPVAVTTIGKLDFVYCGVPDWVYEGTLLEEVLYADSALWISPDGDNIAYAVFNDENVANFSFAKYGTPGDSVNQYPSETVLRYPKPGTPNALVTLHLYNFENKDTIDFELPSTINNVDPNDYLLHGVTWLSDTEVAMVSSNRVQNESIVIRCCLDGQCAEESYFAQSRGWVKVKMPKYSDDGLKKLEILPQTEGDDEFDHLVLTKFETNTEVRLTHGRRSVLAIVGWDEETGLIYYSATVNDMPYQQHIYYTDETGNGECLTCGIIIDGTPCTYSSVLFSKNYSYYVKFCYGPTPYLIQIINNKNASDIFLWEDNADLRQRLANKTLPVIKNLVVPINDQFNARARLYLPPKLDESSSKKYPAIVYTYAGPNSNQITDAYSTGLAYYLATKREYIYILIDGRGSGRDGYNKLFQTYRKLGTVEVDDQIRITKYLQDNLPYIDAKRTGIWGWSYGGFCSSWVLAKDTNHVFLFSLAVAPVTNFFHYDTVYTERYMGLPTADDNEIGYNNTDVVRAAEAFKGRNYFIIHGTGDDNVHVQNSMVMIKALEGANVQFRQHTYADETHSLSGVTRHLYRTIDKYWADQFGVNSSLA